MYKIMHVVGTTFDFEEHFLLLNKIIEISSYFSCSFSLMFFLLSAFKNLTLRLNQSIAISILRTQSHQLLYFEVDLMTYIRKDILRRMKSCKLKFQAFKTMQQFKMFD